MTHQFPADTITNSICGEYPAATEVPTLAYEMTRATVRALAEHYIGMAQNDYLSAAWVQANSGYANTFNAVLAATRITRAAGSDAMDFIDIEKLAERVRAECNARGYVAKSK